MPKKLPCEVSSDGRTVWVNTSDGLIGRFGKMGIDIHSPGGDGHCLLCTHGVTTNEDWSTFVTQMLRIYGCAVGDEHKPERFR